MVIQVAGFAAFTGSRSMPSQSSGTDHSNIANEGPYARVRGPSRVTSD